MFCSAFFGYDQRIATAIRDLGFHVDLFDERPSNSVFAKTCIRYDFKPYHSVSRHYVEKVVASAEKDYDYVFVIKGEALNRDCIELLRKAYPNAVFICIFGIPLQTFPIVTIA